MDPRELLMTALRGVAVYVLMLVVIRLLGKRTVGNFSAFDLLVALMLGEVVDEVIYGDVTFLQGTVAIVTLAAVQFANSWLSFRSPAFARLSEGSPTPVMIRGKFHLPGMRQERMSAAEVMAALRLQGVEKADEVKMAQIEIDGVVSVTKYEWAQPLSRQDLEQALGRPAGGRPPEESPPAMPEPGVMADHIKR